MLRLASLLGLLGLAAATMVIVWSGYEQVLAALGQAGWGIVWTSLAHLLPMVLCILGWQALAPGRRRPSKLFFLYVLWIRSSVNNLMPVARIGGEIVAVRVMMKHHIRKTTAVASTVVETTLSVIGQFAFVLIGIVMFVVGISDENVTLKLLWGVVLSAPVIGALLFVQRVGFFGLMTKLFTLLFRDKWKSFAGNTGRLDHAIRVMYRRRGRALYCFVMQFLSWVACSVEIWLALYFLGRPLPLAKCVMIEALIQAAGSAAFIVPGALGVQEAGFLLFGHFLGLTPEIAAALAVIRRCRDVLLYVPGLIAWQIQEGRWFVQKHRHKTKKA
jgi:glycosyltransferase 2 family protein